MKNFKEFWPYYLSEHVNPVNRRLHFSGTFLLHIIVMFLLYAHRLEFVWVLPIVGYGFSWLGHFAFERNRPATFRHPIWSLIGDFKLFYLMLIGRHWN